MLMHDLNLYLFAGLLRRLGLCVAVLATFACSEESSRRESPAAPFAPTEAVNLPTYAAEDEATTDFVEGLEQLRQANYGAAATAFEASLVRNPDDPQALLARGVAYLLGERFDEAKRDFLRLPREHRHGQVWNYAHSVMTRKMSGLPAVPENMVQSYEETACANDGMFVPGHVIQGDETFSTDYASHIVYEMARAYGRKTCGLSRDRAEIDPLLRSAGRWFAHLNMTNPKLVGYQINRAARLLKDGELEGAHTYANFARMSSPTDPRVENLIALIHLKSGQVLSARKGFTRALALGSRSVDAFAGRGTAMLFVGDERSAFMSLGIAEAIDEDGFERWDEPIDQAEDYESGELDPDSLLQSLATATRMPLSEAERTHLARDVHRYWEPRRLRYDEIYEAQVRELHARATNDPDDPEAWVELARYIANEVALRGEAVEKGRTMTPYRHQVSQDIEFRSALRFADRALAVDQYHTSALMMRAEILNRLGKAEEAEAIAQQVLSIDPNDPQAAVLFAMFRSQRAANLRSAAAALRSDDCTSSTSTENRWDGVYRVTRTRCTPPTQSELNRAAQYDREADRLQQQSRQVMRHALEVSRGTYVGYLLQADVALWSRDIQSAVSALRLAVDLDPEDKRAHEALAKLLPQVSDHAGAAEHKLKVLVDLQTTSAPLLKLARSAIEARNYATAGPILERALSLDPQDGRAVAYLGVVYEGLQRFTEAEASYRTAMALELARIDMDGGGTLQRPIEDYGLYLSTASRLAALLENRGEDAKAITAISVAVEKSSNWRPGWQSTEMYAGLLPGTSGEVKNGATVVASMQVFLGRAAQRAKAFDIARTHFQAAIELGPNPDIPRIRSGSGSTNFSGYAGEPVGEAMLGMMEIGVAQQDFAGARKAITNMGYVSKSQETGMQIAQLERQLRRAEQYQNNQQIFGQHSPEQIQRLKSSLKPHSALVGKWVYMPEDEWRLAGPGGRYSFQANGRFLFQGSHGDTHEGIWGAQGNNYRPVERITLLTDGGNVYEYYVEQQADGAYSVTESNGAKFMMSRSDR